MTNTKEQQKILVVDDDPAQRMLLNICLERDGYKVEEADDGIAAYKLIEKNSNLRIVVTDLDMPNGNGFELIQKIRAGELHYTYIIVLTSKEDESSLVKALSLGADDYIHKPVRTNELRLRIQGGIRVLKQETQEELIRGFGKTCRISQR